MGLLDTVLGWFGIGGASLALVLDAEKTPAGGFVSGKVKVTGGNNEQDITSLKVKLLFVSVKTNDDSPLPDIETEIMVDNTIAKGKKAIPGQTDEYDFSFQVPADLEASAHNISYTIMAAADIPGAKDPSAKVDLAIIESDGATADSIFSRWPALRGSEEEPWIQAVRDMRWKHDADDEENDLLAAEPILAKAMREGGPEKCAAALDTWANIMDGRVTGTHMRVLLEVDKREDLDGWDRQSVIEVAGKYRKHGGMTLLKKYIEHENPSYRRYAAGAMDQYSGDFIGEELDLLKTKLDDEDAEVRSAVLSAMATYDNNRHALEMVAGRVDVETDPEVLSTIERACTRLFWRDEPECKELALATVEKLAGNEHAKVRWSAANGFSFLEKLDPEGDVHKRTMIVFEKLMSDDNQRVRDMTATELYNNISKVPGLWDMSMKLVESEQIPEIRKDIMGVFGNAERDGEAYTFYRGVLEKGDADEYTSAGILRGIRYNEDSDGKKDLLNLLAQGPHQSVAKDAKEALADD